jgi:hypothetical protein
MPNLPGSCEHEAAVRELARSTGDAPALRAHIERCAVCRETLAVATWLQQLAALPSETPSSLDPTMVWLRAELLRRWDVHRTVVTPIEVGESVQAAVGIASAAVLLVWLWTRLAAGPGSVALSSVLTIMVIVGAVLIVGAATMTRELMKRRE